MENKEVSITLTVAEWNVVMNAIAQRPFAEVANIITNVKSQADKVLSEKQEGQGSPVSLGEVPN